MGLRIMVFDDDEIICTLLQRVLSERGYEVTTFSDPTEFPFFNEKSCPCPEDLSCTDILIADIIMPNVKGVDFIKKLKESGCRPLNMGHVAIMSGYLTIHYMSELQELGIHYLRKPFHLQDLYSWVDSCRDRIEQQTAGS